jgi:sigma-B regulation protein RsbQ
MTGVIERNNVHVHGVGDRAMVFAHGFGCDQNMWRFVAPAFEKDFKTVVFDHVGAGGSDLSAYDGTKYSSLSGYADDVVEIGTEFGLKDAVFVGHSVSSMIGVLAVQKAPGMFGKLVLVGPSARYIDDEGYVGGFSPRQIEELLPISRIEPHGMVDPNGADDHGQSRPAGAGPGTDEQLLPHGSRDREGLRSRHLHIRQPP